MEIGPQPGFQYNFLRSNADIVIGGGAAGCGKTHALLSKPLRHILNVKGFNPVFFRRTYPQIRNTGGLWDASGKMYPYLGAKPVEGERWKFENGNKITFSHLQHEKNIFDHQGAEYPFIGFDELTHFSESQFFYMLSRNRSTCGVKPQTVATCNPDPDSFVARLIEWWIDQKTGFPIPERAGVKRYFVKDDDTMIWGDTKDEVIKQAKYLFDSIPPEQHDHFVKSLTFIPGNINENKELLNVNPGYLANLMSQDENMKSRLLYGNWKIRPDNTSLFNWAAINDIFSNYTDGNANRYITCDAARYGRDLCVIFVWEGWQVIHTSILKLSDVHDIVKEVEWCREKFIVQKSKTLIDADGVGSDTVKKGRYAAFHGGSKAKNKEMYDDFKTQCYYKLAEENINVGNFSIQLTNGTCKIDGHFTTKIKIGSNLVDVRDLIIADLRAIKREGDDIDGKKKTNHKDKQKNILGRSPDFGDSAMMRKSFDFEKGSAPPIMRK